MAAKTGSSNLGVVAGVLCIIVGLIHIIDGELSPMGWTFVAIGLALLTIYFDAKKQRPRSE
ncbi:hypothetical protein BRC19_00970 [Candidatus Saccharibacteria bacterium QS_5_54_17]|nr:MAG: hypothetical protein BRC19_00970 [Candidatus Saccharibacteria bacterium QS_5_54_17]